jgi:hypothetical protein
MRRFALIALIALVTLAGVGTAAAPTASFQETSYEAPRDGSTTMTVSLRDTDTTEFRFGSQAAGYRLNATLTDADGDGSVTLRLDIPAANSSEQTLTVIGEDTVTVTEEWSLPRRLADGDYTARVAAAGRITDTVSFTVLPASDEQTTTKRTTTTATTESTTTTATSTPDRTTPESTTADSTTTTGGESGGSAAGFGIGAAAVAVTAAAGIAARRY